MDETSRSDEDSPSALDTEESLDIATRHWNRVISAATKTGYREGKEEGSESVFQEGFDRGYEEAFRNAFLLGKFKSLTNVVPPEERDEDVILTLDKTRRGACRICSLESQRQRNEAEKKSLSEVVQEQRRHSAEVIRRLHEYFRPVAEKYNVDLSDACEIYKDAEDR